MDVVASEHLQATGLRIAGRLVAGASAAQAGAKALLRNGLLDGLPIALENERETFVRLSTSSDFDEGVRAFCMRRPASFG
ncbi:enoyl-CoA hydratase [compost metagenome]